MLKKMKQEETDVLDCKENHLKIYLGELGNFNVEWMNIRNSRSL